MTTRTFRRTAISWGTLLILISAIRCRAQDREVLCSDGEGKFRAEFRSGVAVRVGAAKSGGLATRACEATLVWSKQVETVGTNAAKLDLDAFGVDLGLDVPIAAFQVQSSGAPCCVEYKLYSLEKPPHLLRTISGGDSFSAADTDLDGRVEIWTTDAAAVSGFEKLNLAELDSAPTIVLRFEHGRLLDASPEFRAFFDNQITLLRKQLTPIDLRNFKNSDGILSVNDISLADQLHRLRQVKVKVLEIVWSYLYSGREPQAWNSLAEMWPESDIARIHSEIVDARAHGILAQVVGVSSGRSAKKRKRARIFDAEIQSSGGNSEVTAPEPILLRRPPPEIPSDASSPSELLLELTIDSAGKVRSAEPTGRTKSMDPAVIQATNGWKFIPAFNGSRPVASKTRLAVSLRQ